MSKLVRVNITSFISQIRDAIILSSQYLSSLYHASLSTDSSSSRLGKGFHSPFAIRSFKINLGGIGNFMNFLSFLSSNFSATWMDFSFLGDYGFLSLALDFSSSPYFRSPNFIRTFSFSNSLYVISENTICV